MKLHNYFRSSASYRVRLALEAKELKYEYIPVHLIKDGGQQKHSHYLEINPMAQVPCLVDGDVVLNQSMAIIDYLDNKYRSNIILFPNDIEFKVKEFCEIINSGIQPLQNLSTTKKLDDLFRPSDVIKSRWVHHFLENGFVALESCLKTTSSNYCFANQITAADCFLLPQVFSAHRFGYKTDKFSNITRVCQNLGTLSFVKRAHPDVQPDAES